MNVILIVALLSGVVADDFELPPGVMFDSTTVSGEFLGFAVNEGANTLFLSGGEDVESYMSKDPLLDYFLSMYVGDRVVLVLGEAQYTTDEGETMRVSRILDARACSAEYSSWLDSLRAEGDPEELIRNLRIAPSEHIYGE